MKNFPSEARWAVLILALFAAVAAVYGINDYTKHNDGTPFYFAALCAVLSFGTFAYTKYKLRKV